MDNQNAIRGAARGPALLEDQLFREKMTAFDHERIPERVVHVRGAATHGVFETYPFQAAFTRADFLCAAGEKTPAFVRFSTMAGSRGSADTARDVRGFAVKFYTNEGNYDIVGTNILSSSFRMRSSSWTDLCCQAGSQPRDSKGLYGP